MSRSLALLAAGAFALPIACAAAAPAKLPSWSVSAHFAVGGEGRWDLLAVDSTRHHLFLSRSDHVDVVDTRTGKLAGRIDGTDGVHGIAVAPSLGRGYATNGKANSVTEFDLRTLKRIRDLPVGGQSPDAIEFDAASGRVFAFNAHSNNASVLDPKTGKELALIAFEGNPELGASDGKGHLFVNIEDKAQLVRIDTRAMRVEQTWALAGCEGPTGLALDAAHGRLFSACDNGHMVVSDAVDGHQVAVLDIGEGPDGAAFDAASGNAFSPNGHSGTITVVHEDDPQHFRVVQTIASAASARTIALDPKTHRLYLPAARFGEKPADPKQRPPMIPGSFEVLVVAP